MPSAFELPGRLRFDVNLSILFAEEPLLRRPAAAAAEGFEAVELWWPFDRAVPPAREVDDLVDAIGSAGLTLACLNVPAGDFAAGERGLLSLAGRTPELLEGAAVAADVAGRLGCRVLNALYGNRDARMTAGAQRDVAAANLARVAEIAARAGATAVVEPLNAEEYPRYGLHSIADAASLIGRVRREAGLAPGLLFDAYHVGRGEGHVLDAWERHAPLVAHVQIADVPGRGRPGSGGLPFDRLFAALGGSGYEGFVGLEYVASPDPAETFGWLPRPRRRSGPGR